MTSSFLKQSGAFFDERSSSDLIENSMYYTGGHHGEDAGEVEFLGQPVNDNWGHDVDRDDDRADVDVGSHQLGPQFDQEKAHDCSEDDPPEEDVDKDPQTVAD